MMSDNGQNLRQREAAEREYSLMFVYGSLKQGYRLHYHLREQQFLGSACTMPLYRLFDCGTYPGMVKVAAEGLSVKGELYRVDAECRSRLDEAESVDEGLYQCDSVKLRAPFADLAVLAYFYLPSTTELRDCGASWPTD